MERRRRGVRRAWPAAWGVAAIVASAALVAGCTAPVAAGPTSRSSTPAADSTTATGDPAGAVADEDLHYPDGASAETPECQAASAATVEAVNAAMTVPEYLPEGSAPFAVSGLSASVDPANAVWLLTGTILRPGGGEGQLAVWATVADPTQPAFEGPLRSIGSQTAAISSAPGLQFPATGKPFDLPVAALRCASGATRG